MRGAWCSVSTRGNWESEGKSRNVDHKLQKNGNWFRVLGEKVNKKRGGGGGTQTVRVLNSN